MLGYLPSFCFKLIMCHFEVIQAFFSFHHLICMNFESWGKLSQGEKVPVDIAVKYLLILLILDLFVEYPRYNLINSGFVSFSKKFLISVHKEFFG